MKIRHPISLRQPVSCTKLLEPPFPAAIGVRIRYYHYYCYYFSIIMTIIVMKY